jgi:hypothetical protein
LLAAEPDGSDGELALGALEDGGARSLGLGRRHATTFVEGRHGDSGRPVEQPAASNREAHAGVRSLVMDAQRLEGRDERLPRDRLPVLTDVALSETTAGGQGQDAHAASG